MRQDASSRRQSGVRKAHNNLASGWCQDDAKQRGARIKCSGHIGFATHCCVHPPSNSAELAARRARWHEAPAKSELTYDSSGPKVPQAIAQNLLGICAQKCKCDQQKTCILCLQISIFISRKAM